jgi:hypothetical protein
MSGIAKAALAAAVLNCGLLTASAGETSTGQWLKDGSAATGVDGRCPAMP